MNMDCASAPPRRILIILLGAIGDVARALPLAARLKRHWPEAELHWAVEPISSTLVQHHPCIDRALVFDRPRGLPAYAEFLKLLRAQKYDLVIDAQRHLKSGFTSLMTGGSRRIGFHRRNSREFNWLFNNEHIAPMAHYSSKLRQFQAFGDALGLAPMDPLDFGLQPSAEELDKVEKLVHAQTTEIGYEAPRPEKRAALILGSTWPSRFWTADHYAALISRLYAQYGMVCQLIGGGREKQFAASIIAALGSLPAVNLVEQTTLHELSAVFSRSRLAVGSDSGPMHIAAAVNCPVISLWGSTSPERSAPWGSEHLVIQSAIGCSPCYRSICPGLDTLCMAEIQPEQVLQKVALVLESG